MMTNNEILDADVRSTRTPKGIQSLCTELSHTGQLYLQRITLAINEVAPRPGTLVYFTARKLAIQLNGLDVVVYSAIDACTLLQVAQAYHSLTTAAAVSFVDFVAETFLFDLSQIRTPAERPFHNSTNPPCNRDFSVLIEKRGYIHSPITDPSQDALYATSSKLLFGGISEGALVHVSAQELQRELARFLFFHNNFRYVACLGGKTPLQKLRTFEGFDGIHSFSPCGGFEEGRWSWGGELDVKRVQPTYAR